MGRAPGRRARLTAPAEVVPVSALLLILAGLVAVEAAVVGVLLIKFRTRLLAILDAVTATSPGASGSGRHRARG